MGNEKAERISYSRFVQILCERVLKVYEDREKEGEEVGVLVLDIQGILAILPQ